MYLSDNAIDVSGRPGERVCIGFVSFNSHFKKKTISLFYKKFPSLLRSKIKATKLNENVLLNIISFLNEHKVKMYAVEFTLSDWSEWKNFLGKEAFFNERIYAILYYKLLKAFCYRGSSDFEYTVTVCEEGNLRIDRVLDTCRRLCRAGRINVFLNKGRAKHMEIIKFADYVAGALRKVNKKKLKEFEHYKILNNKLQEREVNKSFRLYKKPKILKKIKF